MTAARNAAAAGPSREELERRRAEEDARRAEEDAPTPSSPARSIVRRVWWGESSDALGRRSRACRRRAGRTWRSIKTSTRANRENRIRARAGVDVATELVENLLLSTGVAGGLLVTPGQVTRHVECPKESVGKIIGRGGRRFEGYKWPRGAFTNRSDETAVSGGDGWERGVGCMRDRRQGDHRGWIHGGV